MAGEKKDEPQRPDVAARKFEYKEGMDDSPIMAGGSKPAPLVSKEEKPKGTKGAEAEDEGLGRLLKAKKRAKDEMDQE